MVMLDVALVSAPFSACSLAAWLACALMEARTACAAFQPSPWKTRPSLPQLSTHPPSPPPHLGRLCAPLSRRPSSPLHACRFIAPSAEHPYRGSLAASAAASGEWRSRFVTRCPHRVDLRSECGGCPQPLSWLLPAPHPQQLGLPVLHDRHVECTAAPFSNETCVHGSHSMPRN